MTAVCDLASDPFGVVMGEGRGAGRPAPELELWLGPNHAKAAEVVESASVLADAPTPDWSTPSPNELIDEAALVLEELGLKDAYEEAKRAILRRLGDCEGVEVKLAVIGDAVAAAMLKHQNSGLDTIRMREGWEQAVGSAVNAGH